MNVTQAMATALSVVLVDKGVIGQIAWEHGRLPIIKAVKEALEEMLDGFEDPAGLDLSEEESQQWQDRSALRKIGKLVGAHEGALPHEVVYEVEGLVEEVEETARHYRKATLALGQLRTIVEAHEGRGYESIVEAAESMKSRARDSDRKSLVLFGREIKAVAQWAMAEHHFKGLGLKILKSLVEKHDVSKQSQNDSKLSHTDQKDKEE